MTDDGAFPGGGLIDYSAFAPTGSADEDTVVAAHELYTKLIGLWTPAIIEAAFELGVYPVLDGREVTSDHVARALSLDAVASRILLDGLHACGIVLRRLDGDGAPRYRLEDRIAPLLLGSGLYHLQGKLTYDRTVAWPAWERLADTIRNGRASDVAARNQNSEENYVSLVRRINFWAPHAVETLRSGLREDLKWDLSRPTSVLDVGCGTGIYSQLLLQKEPAWTATGLETPKVAEIAVRQADELGVGGRFLCRHMDIVEDDWGEGHDVVLVVNIFHLFSPSTAQGLVDRTTRALRPGGCLAVIDHIVDDAKGTLDEPQDRFAALFAVSMLSTGGGDAHRASDYDRWMRVAGLRPLALRAAPMHRVLLAVSPACRVPEVGYPW